VLFGAVSPSGRLPVTFYRSAEDLPPFSDYRMAGRTYRYFNGTPAYPFGAGLGYAPVSYGNLTATATAAGGATAQVTVTNQGALPTEEVVQLYVAPSPRLLTEPLRSLVAFRRVPLAPKETKTVTLDIPPASLTRVTPRGERSPVPGPWQITTSSLTTTVDIPAPNSPSAPPAISTPERTK
jgi:beta-glucosidase